MRVSWEDIVDSARGLASPETLARVQADPTAAARLRRLQAVAATDQTEVPDFYRDRAKALIPLLTTPRTNILGTLLGQTGSLAAGFRSGVADAQNLRFRFDLPNQTEGSVDLRVEAIPRSQRLRVIGQADLPNRDRLEIRSRGVSFGWTDESGEFQFELTDPAGTLEFHDPMNAEIYEVKLP